MVPITKILLLKSYYTTKPNESGKYLNAPPNPHQSLAHRNENSQIHSQMGTSITTTFSAVEEVHSKCYGAHRFSDSPSIRSLPFPVRTTATKCCRACCELLHATIIGLISKYAASFVLLIILITQLGNEAPRQSAFQSLSSSASSFPTIGAVTKGAHAQTITYSNRGPSPYSFVHRYDSRDTSGASEEEQHEAIALDFAYYIWQGGGYAEEFVVSSAPAYDIVVPHPYFLSPSAPAPAPTFDAYGNEIITLAQVVPAEPQTIAFLSVGFYYGYPINGEYTTERYFVVDPYTTHSAAACHSTQTTEIRQCKVHFVRSGVIGVSIQQTAMNATTATVFVNSVAVASCGGFDEVTGEPIRFADGSVGVAGECAVYSLCFLGAVPEGAHVEVRYSKPFPSSPSPPLDGNDDGSLGGSEGDEAPSPSRPCNGGTMGVILEQFTLDDVPMGERGFPITYDDDVYFMTERPVEDFSLGAKPLLTFRAFVYKATKFTLEVAQTGYNCEELKLWHASSLFTPATITCPHHTIEVRAGDGQRGCQQCGGLKGFYSHRNGQSHRSSAYFLCDETIDFTKDNAAMCSRASNESSLIPPSSSANFPTSGAQDSGISYPSYASSSTSYTGFITVTVIPSSTFSGGEFMGSLRAESAALDWYGSGSDEEEEEEEGVRIPVFPHADDYGMVPHLVAPLNTSEDALRQLLGLSRSDPSDLFSLKPFMTIKSRDKLVPRGLHFVDWWSPPYPVDLLSGNATVACVMDLASGASSTAICQIPIPLGATKVKVSVAQTDFATTTMTVAISRNGESVSRMCGDGYPFGFNKGTEKQCDTYFECVNEYLSPLPSGYNWLYGGSINVYIDGATVAHECEYPAVVIVSFEEDHSADDFAGCDAPSQAPASSSASSSSFFECPRERRCIPFESLCDGVQDCFTNADEYTCGTPFILPGQSYARGDAVVALTRPLSYSQSDFFEECRRVFISVNSYVFLVMYYHNMTCLVYSRPYFEFLELTDDSDTLINDSRATLYIKQAAWEGRGFLYPNDKRSFKCRDSIHCSGNGNVSTDESGECICNCFSGYLGADCSQKANIATYTAAHLLVRLPSPQFPVHIPVLSSTLTTSSGANAHFTCLYNSVAASIISVTPPNIDGNTAHNSTENNDADSGTLVGVDCLVSNPANGEKQLDPSPSYQALLRPSAITRINAALSVRQHPLVQSISLRTAITEKINSIVRNCTYSDIESGDFIVGGRCVVSEHSLQIRLSAVLVRPLVSIRISVERASSPPSTSRTTDENENPDFIEFRCLPQTNYVPFGDQADEDYHLIGCIVSSCEINYAVSPGDVIRFVNEGPQNLVHAPAIDDAEGTSYYSCGYRAVEISGYSHPLGRVVEAATEAAVITPAEHKPFLISGIIIFIAGCLVCWAVAVYFGLVHRVAKRRALAAINFDGMSELAVTKTRMLVDLALERDITAASAPPAEEKVESASADSAGDTGIVKVDDAPEGEVHNTASPQFAPQPSPQRNHHHNNRSGWFALRDDSRAVVFALIGLLFGLVAAFLIIYWATGEGRTANLHVIYEEFGDSDCSESVVAPMPTRVFTVGDGEFRCNRMESTGEAAGLSYAAADCSGDVGDYTVRLRLGTSKIACDGSTEMFVPSGQCQPLRNVLPTTDRNVYVKVTCAAASATKKRFDSFVAISQRDDVMTMVSVHAPEDSLNLLLHSHSTTQMTSSDQAMYADNVNVLSLGFVAGAVRRVATSFEGGVLDSQATPSHFDGRLDPRRVVLQHYECIFRTVGAADCQQPLEEAAGPVMGLLAGKSAARDSTEAAHKIIETHAPHIPDAPVGFILNGFGTGAPSRLETAGQEAHKYYGAAGTAFDMGLHFPKDQRQDPGNDEGYTISLYLRADETTQGFAFAVTDAFEHSFDKTVYPLQRLGDIIANGQGGAEWFKRHTPYNVYQSLYVNGPGKSLVFAYASTIGVGNGADADNDDDAVHLLEYDLAVIGMERVLNGLWHHIAISFLVENGRIRAQLAVDGESSYTRAGWSVCVDKLPPPIADVGTTAPVFSAVTDRVTKGGVIVTGYFNGGIYNVRATAEPLLITDFLQSGSQAMRDNNPFPRTSTLTLAIIIITVSCALLVLLIFIGFESIGRMQRDNNAHHAREAAALYYDLLASVVYPSTMKSATTDLFPSGSFDLTTSKKSLIRSKREKKIPRIMTTAMEDAQTPTGGSAATRKTTAVKPLRLVAALQWLNLSTKGFLTVMKEIQQQTEGPVDRAGEALLLVLLRTQLGVGSEKTHFTVQEWNEEVSRHEDKKEEREHSIFSRVNFSEKAMEMDICGDEDFFETYFGRDDPEHPEDAVVITTEFKIEILTRIHQVKSSSFPLSFPITSSPTFSGDFGSMAQVLSVESFRVDGSGLFPSSPDKKRRKPLTKEKKVGAGDVKLKIDNHGLESVTPTNLLGGEFAAKDATKSTAAATKAITTTAAAAATVPSDQVPLVGGDTAVVSGGNTKVNASQLVSFAAMVGGFQLPHSTIAAQLVGIFISVCQTIHVWATSIEFPALYDHYFRELFSFASIDFTMAFDDLSTLVTPLLQLFVGLLVVGLAVFFVYEDGKHFDQVLAQYVWRRDALEGGGEGEEKEDYEDAVTADIVKTSHRALIGGGGGDGAPMTAEEGPPHHASSASVNHSTLDSLPAHLRDAMTDPYVPLPTVCKEALPVASARIIELFAGISEPIAKKTKSSSKQQQQSPPSTTTDPFSAPPTTAHVTATHATEAVEMKALPPLAPIEEEKKNIPNKNPFLAVSSSMVRTPKAPPNTTASDVFPLPPTSAPVAADEAYALMKAVSIETASGEELTVVRRDGAEFIGRIFVRAPQPTPSVLHSALPAAAGGEQKAVSAVNPLAIVPPPQAVVGTTSTSDGGLDGGDNNATTLQRDAHDSIVPIPSEEKEEGESLVEMLVAGVCCARHPTRRLTAQVQTDIWPFANAPFCCLIVNGEVCGERLGTIYSCCQRSADAESGGGGGGDKDEDDGGIDMRDEGEAAQRRRHICTYALCEKHYRATVFDQVIGAALATVRRVTLNGWRWALCVVAVMAANAAYTPIIKTALMILGCHPFYQCEFEQCWDTMDQKFALAVFCCLCIIVFFGIGFPALVFVVLWSRKHAMDATFVAPEYKGRYAPQQQQQQQQPSASEAVTLSETTSPSSPTAYASHPSGGLFAFLSATISEVEWGRFVSTDSTAMAQQYQTVYFRWMFYPSVAILFKVLQLIPAIFIEPRTFEQRLGCAVVQLFVTVFMFTTTTQLSPVVLTTLRAAELHNLLILGLQNLALVVLNDSNSDISAVLVAVTLSYIVVNALIFVGVFVYPLYQKISTTSALADLLAHNGYEFSAGTSLFVNPLQLHLEQPEGNNAADGVEAEYSDVEEEQQNGGVFEDDAPSPAFNIPNNNARI